MSSINRNIQHLSGMADAYIFIFGKFGVELSSTGVEVTFIHFENYKKR